MSEKRSYTSFLWLLFGAGGMISAVFFPIFIIFVCFMLPFSSPDIDARFISFLMSKTGALFIVIMTLFPLWCACFRLTHLMDECKIRCKNKAQIMYVITTILSVIVLLFGAIRFFN